MSSTPVNLFDQVKEKALAIFPGNRNALLSFREEYSRAVSELEAKRARLSYLATAPLPQVDVAARIHAYIDRQAELFIDGFAMTTANFAVAEHEPGIPEQSTPLFDALGVGLGSPAAQYRVQSFICLAIPEQAKAAVAKALAAHDWSAAGPSLAHRAKERAELERDIAALEARISAAENEARELGIQLETRSTKKEPKMVTRMSIDVGL